MPISIEKSRPRSSSIWWIQYFPVLVRHSHITYTEHSTKSPGRDRTRTARVRNWAHSPLSHRASHSCQYFREITFGYSVNASMWSFFIWQVKGLYWVLLTQRVFPAFPSCSQMSFVFYHSVIHGSRFFVCFMTEVMWQKTIKHAFSMFYPMRKHVFFFNNQSTRRVLSFL